MEFRSHGANSHMRSCRSALQHRFRLKAPLLPAANALAKLTRAVPDTASALLRALRSALDNHSFMVNGGRLGFACQVSTAGWLMATGTLVAAQCCAIQLVLRAQWAGCLPAFDRP